MDDRQTDPRIRKLRRLRVTDRRALRAGVAGTAAGVAVLVALFAVGAVRSEQDLLVFIGFDPDRSALLTALTMGALATFVAALAAGQRRLPATLSLVGLVALFGDTWVAETNAALRAHGDQGSFDAAGWVVTLIALVVAGLVVGWAAATLAGAVRDSLIATGRQTGPRVRSAGLRGLANRRLASTVVVAVLLAVSGSAVVSMINYSPDALFHVSDPGVIGLAPGGPGGTSGTGQAAQGGSVDYHPLPAPWVGGTSTQTSVSVYMPRGYEGGKTQYPVVYALPWGFAYWEQGIHIQELLDGLIARKEIPPTLVVFPALSTGGPYPDTECADSADGTEHVETYLSTTLPAWIDAHYRTIADADHRTLFGFSQGGFCATMLQLRHTDLFHYAISFGGYYTAAITSPETVNAARPWGDSTQLIASHSPMLLAANLPPAVASRLFIVLSGTPSQPFYGAQYSAFVDELATDGIPDTTIDTEAAHSWPSVQADLPIALVDVANTQRERNTAAGASPSP